MQKRLDTCYNKLNRVWASKAISDVRNSESLLEEGIVLAPEPHGVQGNESTAVFIVDAAIYLHQSSSKIRPDQRSAVRSGVAQLANVKETMVHIECVKNIETGGSCIELSIKCKCHDTTQCNEMQSLQERLHQKSLTNTSSEIECAPIYVHRMRSPTISDHGSSKTIKPLLTDGQQHLSDRDAALIVPAHQCMYYVVYSDGTPVGSGFAHKPKYAMSRVVYNEHEKQGEQLSRWIEVADATCRWKQSTFEMLVQVFLHGIRAASELYVCITVDEVKVAHSPTGTTFLAGRLEGKIDSWQSFWHLSDDGTVMYLHLTKDQQALHSFDDLYVSTLKEMIQIGKCARLPLHSFTHVNPLVHWNE